MSTLTRHDFVKAGAMSGFFVDCDLCDGGKFLDNMALCPKCDGQGSLFVPADRPAISDPLRNWAVVALTVLALGSFWVLLSYFK